MYWIPSQEAGRWRGRPTEFDFSLPLLNDRPDVLCIVPQRQRVQTENRNFFFQLLPGGQQGLKTLPSLPCSCGWGDRCVCMILDIPVCGVLYAWCQTQSQAHTLYTPELSCLIPPTDCIDSHILVDGGGGHNPPIPCPVVAAHLGFFFFHSLAISGHALFNVCIACIFTRRFFSVLRVAPRSGPSRVASPAFVPHPPPPLAPTLPYSASHNPLHLF